MTESAKPPLRTKNVFVDTNAHVAAKFGYHAGNLRRLSELADAELAFVFDTPIDEGEIRSNIKEIADAAANGLRRFQREAHALRDVPDDQLRELFKPLASDVVGRHLGEAYDHYRRTARVRRIEIPDDATTGVFQQYFGKKPPFGVGKKRSEFPDAFILMALESWCAREAEQMYVVSDDAGVISAVKATRYLLPLNSVEEFLNLVVSEEHHAQAIRTTRWAAANPEILKTALTVEFEDGAFYLEDADGDVDNVEVVKMSLLGPPLLLEATEHGVTFAVRTSIQFRADITYDDPGSGTYDIEEKRRVFMRRIHVRVQRQDEFDAEITLRFVDESVDGPSGMSIVRVAVGGGRDVGMSHDDEVIAVYGGDEGDDYDDWSEYAREE